MHVCEAIGSNYFRITLSRNLNGLLFLWCGLLSWVKTYSGRWSVIFILAWCSILSESTLLLFCDTSFILYIACTLYRAIFMDQALIWSSALECSITRRVWIVNIAVYLIFMRTLYIWYRTEAVSSLLVLNQKTTAIVHIH